MKNITYNLFVFIFISFVFPLQTITLSGKIINTEDGKIKINGESFEKEILLNEDGSFSANLPICYNGIYNIKTARNNTPVYLTLNSQLTITADDSQFNKTLLFSGNGSVENQYIIDKLKIISSTPNEELYKLNEKRFLTAIKEMKLSIMALHKRTKFGDTYFKEKEAKNINYLEQLYLLNYPLFHPRYAKIENYKIFKDFPQFDDQIDLDNDSDFLFSNTYKQIVSAKFNEKIGVQMANNKEPIEDVALTAIKTLQSQYIKNALVRNLSFEVCPRNPNSEKLYNELIAISTDSQFKENLTAKFYIIKTVAAGKPSPKFSFENYTGGKTTLNSLKGRYVYIKVWTSWSGICRKEITAFQKIKEQYKGRNIEFVSISIDIPKDREKWKAFVNEKQLKGIQLIADNDWNSKFIKEYAIDCIPRFILIDPNGNIVSADAPRPSDSKLIDLFEKCKI